MDTNTGPLVQNQLFLGQANKSSHLAGLEGQTFPPGTQLYWITFMLLWSDL